MAKKMKLVEILARELKEWPEKAIEAYQDADGEVRFNDFVHPDFFASEVALEDGEISCCDGIPWAGPVTREMWESERAKLAKPKGGKDGWCRHLGGKQPVANGVMVKYRMRSGNECPSPVAAESVRWNHSSRLGDIMAYKVVEQPQESAPDPVKEPAQSIETPNPILWRDRVKELDERKLCLDQAHAKHTADIAKEREELIGKLGSQGFLLIGLSSPGSSKEWQIIAMGEDDLVAAVKAHREELGSTLRAALVEVKEYRRQNGIGQ